MDPGHGGAVDATHAQTDKKIAKMQRNISTIYQKAQKEIYADMLKWAKSISPKANELLDKIAAAENESQRRSALDAYAAFCIKQAKTSGIHSKAAKTLYAANTQTASYINSKVSEVYADNYNAIGRELQEQLDGYEFVEVSESEANKYGDITRQKVNEKKDKKWNERNVLAALSSAALLALTIEEVVKRTSKTTAKKNRNSANRQISDMLSDAESNGRLDSMYRAYDEGFTNIQKEWVCIFDNRTRDTHIDYNDLGAVPLDYEYNAGLKRPRDSNCSDLADVCNCRCAITWHTGLARSGTRASRWYAENADRTGFENLVTGSYKKAYSFRKTKTETVRQMTYKEWREWRSR